MGGDGGDGGDPHHGADDPGDVDGVVAAGHIGGWVVLVTGAPVQDGEANVQDVLLKLSPERLCLEPEPQPYSRPSHDLTQSVICVVQGSLPPRNHRPPPRGPTEHPQDSETLPQ